VAVVERHHAKSALAAVWILAAGVTGVMADVTSVGAVSFLFVVGLLPPLIMLFRWRDPPQTLSESIQEARR
jgi:hypothetical protein